MSAAKLPSSELFRRAAELRVRGASWEAIAKEIGRAERTVRDWTRTHARAWRQAVRTAERQLAEEATAESVLTLRRQLRSDDEKTVREAASALIKFATLRQKPRPPTKKPRAGLPPTVAAIAAFVGGLTDEELAALLRQLRQTPGPTGSDPGPAAAGGGGPSGAE